MKKFLSTLTIAAATTALFGAMTLPCEAARTGRLPLIIIIDPGSALSPP